METNRLFAAARDAGCELNMLSEKQITTVLNLVADAVERHSCDILAANALDLERMPSSDPLYDRLLLSTQRIADCASDIRNVALLPSPVGEELSRVRRPNGMVISKVRVPFGVVGVIYEARPNVSLDVFSLCFRTRNAAILKGGSDAQHSNEAIVSVIRNTLSEHGVNPDAVTLLPADREYTAMLLNAVDYVDLVIPRGSASLIRYVRDNARVPVIETGAGVCHTYFDLYADTIKGAEIVFNAKTRRVSVCNALDCLLIHAQRLADLPALCGRLAGKNVVLLADGQSYEALEGHYPAALLQHASEDSYGTEFMDYKMAIRTVDGVHQAMEHIALYSSRHSEAIITQNEEISALFSLKVDAACVYTNVSTAFTDGGQFGFGAEIGISTQKLHARGPMGLAELTSYKYIITGDGQVRW